MYIKGIHIVAASVDYFGKKRTLGTPQDFETALAQFVTLKDAGAKRGSFDFQYWKDDRRQKVNPRPICATISGGKRRKLVGTKEYSTGGGIVKAFYMVLGFVVFWLWALNMAF